ncbi:ABC transporter ATP-binding protein [Microvirga pakistanensis]|uniref:ABC transporter ATP-binding protein n=1 Tax=Microvirga pakistanensis TaxID=1682650 RepID=UPI00106AE412|nr:ABC transporter ATP-binding protein [Microvirga pakistanensis]
MIKLEDLTKTFGSVIAADRINMEVPEGEICILLGPSGCGKTTTLKMVNRLIEKTSGKILVGGRDTDNMDPVEVRRGMGYVIQQIGLFPNMTVEENICVVPRLLKWDDAKAKRRAAELLELVALDPSVFLKRFPRELSGGQQQRVGVARALAADPPVMIMDEPFGAIDPINREIIQDEFLRMQKTLRKTILFVSHDIDEAVKMGDKIAIFRAGKLEQYDTPDTILAHPANSFIADFVGADRTLKRLRLVTVAEAQNGAVGTVSLTDDLSRAYAILREGHLDTIVVLDPQGLPVGWVHAEDAVGIGPVSSRMRPLPATIRTDADLRTAVAMMFTHDVTWLTCINADGRFGGCITQAGITRRLGDTYRSRSASAPMPQGAVA